MKPEKIETKDIFKSAKPFYHRGTQGHMCKKLCCPRGKYYEVMGYILQWKIKFLLLLPFIGQNHQNSLTQKDAPNATRE